MELHLTQFFINGYVSIVKKIFILMGIDLTLISHQAGAYITGLQKEENIYLKTHSTHYFLV